MNAPLGLGWPCHGGRGSFDERPAARPRGLPDPSVSFLISCNFRNETSGLPSTKLRSPFATDER